MGPTVEILLPGPLTEEMLGGISEIIAGVSDRVDGRDFWVTDTRQIGGAHTGPGLPFSLVGGEDSVSAGYGVTEMELVEASFGFSALSSVGLAAHTNSENDHRVLAELAAYLARTLSGVVDLGGALLPAGPEAITEATPWEEVEGMMAETTADARGRLLAIPYQTAARRQWAWHVCDAAFMEWWLAHPGFHMVK